MTTNQLPFACKLHVIKAASDADLAEIGSLIQRRRYRDAFTKLNTYQPCPRSLRLKAVVCMHMNLSVYRLNEVFRAALELNPRDEWLLKNHPTVFARSNDDCIAQYFAVKDALKAGFEPSVTEEEVRGILSTRCTIDPSHVMFDMSRMHEVTAYMCSIHIHSIGGGMLLPLPTEFTDAMCGAHTIKTLCIQDTTWINFVWNMTWLNTLVIKRTLASHDALTTSLHCLTGLEILSFSECDQLGTLPDDINCLHGLKRLCVAQCPNFTRLPDSIVGLTALKRLYIKQCPMITCWPANFDTLQLTSLNLSDLPRMAVLPSLGVSRLECIMLIGLPLITTLSLDIIGMRHLRRVRIVDCKLLSCLPMQMCDLPSISLFYVNRCPRVDDWMRTMLAYNNRESANDVLRNMRACYYPPRVLMLIIAARRMRVRHLPDEIWHLILTDYDAATNEISVLYIN